MVTTSTHLSTYFHVLLDSLSSDQVISFPFVSKLSMGHGINLFLFMFFFSYFPILKYGTNSMYWDR